MNCCVSPKTPRGAAPAQPAFLRLAALLLALFFDQARAVETVLLGDQFLDDERATQTLPRTAKWLYAGGATAAQRLWVTPPGAGRELRMIASGGNGGSAMALAYFTDTIAPATQPVPKVLAAGESMTLDFTAKLDALRDADSNFRVMLFNSLNSRPTADSEATTSNAALYANTHSGYQLVLNTGALTDSFNIHERNNQGNSSPFSLGVRLGTDNLATLNLKVKQTFAGRLKITRSTGAGTSVTIDATINGVTVSRTDSATILTSFDGFGFFFGSDALGSGQALTVDDVTLKHTTVAAVTTTLLDDDFTDNDRTNQALPNSAEWFYAGTSVASERLTTSPPESAQNLVFTPGGTAAMALAYFTASGTPQTLAVGESITFQASVHLDLLANAADGIRFGLFDSGAQRVAADSEAGTNAAIYDQYHGYSVWLNPGASGGFNLYRRDGSGQNPFTAAASTLLAPGNTADLALSTSVEMIPRFSMTITRLTSGMQIEAAINGRLIVRTETTTAAATQFDTLAFFFTSAALYDGPQAVFDTVNVIHTGVIPTVPSAGKIFSQSFDSGTGWTSATSVSAQATSSLATGTFGTINVLGRVVPSGGMKLSVNSTGLTGYWSGALDSGLIPVANTETDLGKLTLAFDLLASSVRPVRVRLESSDLGGVGARERMIYPAVAGSFQRYTFEVADMVAAGGTFTPTAPNMRLTFQIEGGVDAGSWPAGAHSLQIDNVYYAKPAYYVKPGGLDTKDGRSEANAFANIFKALTLADDGDIVLVMAGKSTSDPTYNPLTVDYSLTSGINFARGGVPAGWVVLKNYPGHRPLLKRLEPTGGSYDIISVNRGAKGAVDYTTSDTYIEIRGLRVTGTADTLAVADRGQTTAKSNVNGISANGRYMILVPHHLRFADNEVFNISAGGIGGIDCDWMFMEGNDIHDTSNWTIYGTSGMGQLTPSNFDGTAGTYRAFWLGNRVYRNETKEPWVEIGQISDGNGMILDTFNTTRHGPWLGRAIVANNLTYENGGSGIHAYLTDHADIVNNTAVRNSHSPALTYANIFGASANDVLIANNIIVASAGEPINGASYSSAFPLTTGVTFINNLYLSDGSTVAPYVGPNDSGNVVTTDVKFVDGDSELHNDYRLRTGSPAFNAALASLNVRPVRDFYGILRATDGLPDIGACERQPAIVTAPAAQTGVVGNNLTLSVAAQSGGLDSGLSYQWQRNGVNIAGATGNPLILTNVTLAQAGDYRAVVSVGGVPFDVVTSPAGTLTIWTQLQNWRNTNFGSIANAGNGADSADPDKDGIFNLAEYGLNLLPNTSGLNGLPTSVRDGNGRLVLTFLRARSDVTYLVEGSSDLVSWTTVATNPGAVSLVAPVPVTDNAPANAPRRFLRLHLTNP